MRGLFFPLARSRRSFVSELAPFLFVVVANVSVFPMSWAEALTLEDASVLAEQANPELRAAKSELAAIEGQRKDSQGLLWNNPQLSSDLTRRREVQTGLPAQTFGEWNVGIAQTFELAGQHGYRRDAAQFDVQAINERIEELRRQIRAGVAERFTRLLALQKRAELEREALRLLEDAASAVKKRVKAGEDSRLDGNVATVEAERSVNQLAVLSEQLVETRTELGAFIQLPPSDLPEAVGSLDVNRPTYTLQTLLDSAASRPLFRALNFREQAARSKLALERASTYPDVTVGVTTGREGPGEARQSLTMLSFSVPLPMFKRNAAGVGRATTELTQVQIEKQTSTRNTQAQVRAFWQRRESLQTRVDRLTESVLPKLDENQRLSSISYRVGEINLLQLILVNRQLLDARRDLLEATSELRLLTIALEAAAGWPIDGGRP